MMGDTVETDLTKLLGVKYPIMVAGMGGVTLSELAAAGSNAGGIGTLGAIPFTNDPEGMREEIRKTKALLKPEANGMFGVDLLLPSTDAGARKTNKGVGNELLDQLVDVMIEEGVPLFVCAVGVPPAWVVEKLHVHGCKVMNMIGKPKHATKALAVGVDMICAQGTEGGGHTGEIATLSLIPQIVDACKGKLNAFGTPVPVIAAGGIFDGRGIAACLMLGAAGVWCGSRFLVSDEANVSASYKQEVIDSKSEDTTRIEIFSGRPMRVIKTDYTDEWEKPEKIQEMQALLQKGVVPRARDMKAKTHSQDETRSLLASQAIGPLSKIESAETIMADMMVELVSALQTKHIAVKTLAEVVGVARL